MATVLFLGDVHADMSTPGFKRIEQCVSFDNLGDRPDYVFFLTPMDNFDTKKREFVRRNGYPVRLGAETVHGLGYAVRFGFDWVVLAVPRRQVEAAGDALVWETGHANAPDILCSNKFRFPDYENAIFLDPKAYNLHHFEVELSNGQLKATRTRIEGVSFGVGSLRVPAWFVGLLMTLAIVGLGIWWLRRRARRAKMRASESG
jgi:hypothetical protein